jgi:hypothetical protein
MINYNQSVTPISGNTGAEICFDLIHILIEVLPILLLMHLSYRLSTTIIQNMEASEEKQKNMKNITKNTRQEETELDVKKEN